MSKPLLLPEPYGGEAGGWAEWVDHFENVATVNRATGEEKLKWLKVRLTGKAQTAFKKLPQDVKENYGECMKSLQRRFDPDSKRQLYVAELSARTRHKDEDWATFGDVLRVLADKAYPDLEEKARERLALNQFLAQIENAQVAFGVKQKRPTNVEEAVVATIELESYLGSSGKPLRVSAVSPQEPDPDVRVRRSDRAEAVAAVSPLDEPQTVKLLGERLQRLEMLLERQGSSTRPRTSKQTWDAESGKRKAVVCWTCGKKGHIIIARFCRSRATEQHQGNFSPSVERAYHLSIPFLSKTTTEQGVATVGLVLKEKTVVPAGSEMEVMYVVPVRILNPRDEMVVLKKGTQIASMELLEQDPVINISTVMKNAEVSLECQNILWDLVSKVGSHISESEREQLYSLLVEFADVFSFSSKDLGRTKELKHHIFTSDAQPVHLSPRRIPQARREELRGLLRDMLESDVIQQSDSPWSSPIVLAKKHDGTTRFCVDYRKVNKVTRKDAYPLPRVDDTLDTLVGSKFFTTLDLASGYWQVEVAPEDQPKTAFTTPEGLYQFKVMPFGLCNAPATFQRLMDRVLSGLKWSSCLVYFDDLIVVGTTFQEHLHHLTSVFTRLRGAGLKLKPKKCTLCRQQVTFLGHIVSTDGVATDPSKTEAVSKWPIPQNRKEVQQFLGLANYYRRFVKDFALISKPLQRLTEKNAPFEWTIGCQNAFDELRKRLVSSPVLAYPDYERRFILDTDASDVGIGAVLSQVIFSLPNMSLITLALRNEEEPKAKRVASRVKVLLASSPQLHFSSSTHPPTCLSQTSRNSHVTQFIHYCSFAAMAHHLVWKAGYYGSLPEHAVCGGTNFDGEPLYVARIQLQSGWTPGKMAPSFRTAHAGYGGREFYPSTYEILTNPSRVELKWVPFSADDGEPPPGAVLGGHDKGAGNLYVARVRRPDGMVVPGKACYTYHSCYASYGCVEETYSANCDILIVNGH
eukprot:Em0001g3644a